MSKISSNYYQEFQYLNKIKIKQYAKSNYKKAPGKENIENFEESQENYINTLDEKSPIMKLKKIYTPKKFNVKIKTFYKDGKSTKFNLYKEGEIGLNGWNKKISILESEEDYDSDENVIMNGKAKTKDDLNEAMRLFKRNKFKDINNYLKYCKYGNEI